jgi:hypothetical protein
MEEAHSSWLIVIQLSLRGAQRRGNLKKWGHARFSVRKKVRVPIFFPIFTNQQPVMGSE